MIPVLNATQIKSVDQYTIEEGATSSAALMERASEAFVECFQTIVPKTSRIMVFCGVGNNGGDGMAISRLLHDREYDVISYYIGDLQKATEDFRVNMERSSGIFPIKQIKDYDHIPFIPNDYVIIDALLGSGLSRPLEGLIEKLVNTINDSWAQIFSVDIPSGIFSDNTSDGATIIADHTISFEIPKLSLFQPELAGQVGRWHLVGIGLSKEFISLQKTNYFYTERKDIKLPKRAKNAHKGDAGRMLLISGSKGKMGATVLSAKAAMRTGAGLLFVHAPCCGLDVLQTAVPEAMVIEDEHTEVITEILPADNIRVVAIGPGIGTGSLTVKAFKGLLDKVKDPIVIDADAINILAENRELLDVLPAGSVLTPHPGEFKRLVGEWKDDFEKLELLRNLCKTYKLNVVLKGAHSAVCDYHGIVYFNPTGNPGMATAGSGDVLTGVIAALMAQGLKSFDALKTGVYLHGLAGDLAEVKKGQYSLIASDIIDFLPEAFLKLTN
ncbi:NAD(P)H-hydrate dehydratase [Marinoscillum pacificum]|uniref:NAD(P)H-hydrate dehydratase n=1 Tax=Marinoscillum pacificum TaxID=392723 RepID=UPI002157A065|nr:NAD(P)H-hydrate dehydratase [Marinoscillum pacificum]